MSPSPGHALRAVALQLTRGVVLVVALVLALVMAGVFAGPWSTPQVQHNADDQAHAVAAHEVLGLERTESPAPVSESESESEDAEDDEQSLLAHHCPHPLQQVVPRDDPSGHDALGPPTRVVDVETPPPRA